MPEPPPSGPPLDPLMEQTELHVETPGGGRADSGEPLRRGATLGRYVVLEVMGRGGMGCVYGAYDPQLDRQVALKLLLPTLCGAEAAEARARLLREAQAMARLSHPNVVTVHDVGTVDGQVYMAMELVRGGTLRHWLQEGPRPWTDVLQMFRAAGEGLWAAHQAGLLHRDFKPENVLVGDDGRVRVTDFGVALADGRGLEDTLPPGALRLPVSAHGMLTSPGQLVGTPPYMAPERLRGGTLDARTDQFSFAVALYEALYGERPYQGDDLASLIEAMVSGRIQAPSSTARVPMRIRRALVRALDPDPARRFPSMRELLAVLGRRSLRRAALWGAWATLVALLVATGVGAWLRRDLDLRRCAAQGDLTGIWDEPKRATARAAFLGSKLPYADRAFAEASARLDEVTQRWSAESVAFCREPPQTGRLAVVRQAECLAQQGNALRALGDLFAQADAAVVEKAIDAASRLADREPCAYAVVRARASLPAEPAELGMRVVRAQVLAEAGKLAEAQALGERLALEAREGRHWRLESESWLVTSRAQGMRERRLPALQTARQAVVAAERAADDELVARSRIHLFYCMGFGLLRSPDEVEQAEREAIAAVERAGSPALLELELARTLSLVRSVQGRGEEGLEFARRAWELGRRHVKPQSLAVAQSEFDLAMALQIAGRKQEATVAIERSLSSLERLLGSQHPELAAKLNNAGVAYFEMEDYQRSYEMIRRQMEIVEATAAKDDPVVVLGLANLGEVLQKLERHDEALAVYQRAAAGLSDELTANPVAVSEIQAGLARSYLAQAKPMLAVPLLEKSLALRRQRPGERFNLAKNELDLAEALWQAGRERPRAIQLARDAREVARQSPPFDALVEQADRWLASHPR